MRSLQKLLKIGTALLLLSSCASTQDTAELCTAENTQAASDKSVDRMTRDGRIALRDLSRSSETWDVGNTIRRQDLDALNASLEDFKTQLKAGRGMHRLKTFSSKCENTSLVANSLSQIFTEQGLPAKMTETLKALPAYSYMIESRPEAWKASQIELDIPPPRMEDF